MKSAEPRDVSPQRASEVELFSLAGVDGRFREVNAPFAALLGVRPRQLEGQSVLELVHPRDVSGVVAGLAELSEGAVEVLLETRFRTRDGTWLHVQWVARPVPGTTSWWAAGRDTTVYHELLAEDRDLRARYDLLVDYKSICTWELDVAQDRLDWEPGAERLLAIAQDQLPATARALTDLVSDHAGTRALVDLEPGGVIDVDFTVGADLDLRHLSLRGKVLTTDRRGRPARVVGLVLDVSDERALQEQMLVLVMRDALTGIPNRRSFDHTLRSEWRRATREGSCLSVVMIDIDDFKKLNDALGHLVGDEVLTAVSRALTTCLHRAGDTVARFGGEEFALVLPGVDHAGAVAVATTLCEAVREVQVRQAPGWDVAVSVGTASWSPAEQSLDSPAQLLARADHALYAAKEAGKDRVVSYETSLAGRDELEDAIRAGITAGEFEMWYQPVVDLRDLSVVAFEALMRWRRPVMGLVAPVAFIPQAERSDLICDLGRVALAVATRDAVGWAAAPTSTTPPRVAVNLSGRHLAQPGVVEDVGAALRFSGLPSGRLEVELTETALAHTAGLAIHLAEIQRLGATVSIDDFGTGYTSVGQLSSLAADVIKIDRSFVSSSDPRRRALVGLMVAAAQPFGMRVIGEGAEDVDTVAWLAGLGCAEVQGYAIARPMPAAAVDVWLSSWPRTRAELGLGPIGDTGLWGS